MVDPLTVVLPLKDTTHSRIDLIKHLAVWTSKTWWKWKLVFILPPLLRNTRRMRHVLPSGYCHLCFCWPHNTCHSTRFHLLPPSSWPSWSSLGQFRFLCYCFCLTFGFHLCYYFFLDCYVMAAATWLLDAWVNEANESISFVFQALNKLACAYHLTNSISAFILWLRCKKLQNNLLTNILLIGFLSVSLLTK